MSDLIDNNPAFSKANTNHLMSWVIGKPDNLWELPDYSKEKAQQLDTEINTIVSGVKRRYPKIKVTGIIEIKKEPVEQGITRRTLRFVLKRIYGDIPYPEGNPEKPKESNPDKQKETPEIFYCKICKDNAVGYIGIKEYHNHMSKVHDWGKTSNTKVELELDEQPYLSHEIRRLFNTKRYSDLTEAQLFETKEWTDIHGRVVNALFSNVYKTRKITRIPTLNFGSISDNDIDTMPKYLSKCKGTLITRVTNIYKSTKQKSLISRRFLSGILSVWSNMANINYRELNDYAITGVKLWCIPDDTGKGEFLTGDIAINMLKDIIYMTRNKPAEHLKQQMVDGKLSPQLFRVIDYKMRNDKTTYKKLFGEMKKKLYYNYRVKDTDMHWEYPRYHIKYLRAIIKELRSEHYLTDILVSIVKDMVKFPIKCTDMHICNPIQQIKTRDDYDLTQYLFERD